MILWVIPDSWTTSESLGNHQDRSYIESSDSLVILKVILDDDLKIHAFLEAVESKVSAVLRFKDPAKVTDIFYSSNFLRSAAF